MLFNEFLDVYSIDFLSKIDSKIHNKMLEKFLSLEIKSDLYTFFDVGSNAGSFIKSVKEKKINSSIHAFEPHPYLYDYLKKTYIDEKINCCCVTNQDGKCNINIPSLSVAISSVIDRPVFQKLKKTQKVHVIESDSISIDTYCSNENIDVIHYIKIDVEGAEYFVLDGSKKMLSEKRIICGQFEVGIEDSEFGTDHILNLLESYGYVVDKCFENDYFFYIK